MTDCVAVLGLGLIGGSLARDLAAAGVRVIGYDHDPQTLAAALAEGILHRAAGRDLEGIEDAGLVVIAVPVGSAAALLAQAARRNPEAVLTDVGSTKRSIVHAAGELGVGDRFVGAHPLAGDHRSGWGASRAGLFRDAVVYLTPHAHSSVEAVGAVDSFWRSVGGRVTPSEPEAHDALLALTSHLPQAVASAVARTLAAEGIAPEQLGPGGRDVTRLAASSPALWAEIGVDNGEKLSGAVAAVQAALAELRLLLDARDQAGLREWFARGNAWSGKGADVAEGRGNSVAAAPRDG